MDLNVPHLLIIIDDVTRETGAAACLLFKSGAWQGREMKRKKIMLPSLDINIAASYISDFRKFLKDADFF
jgi:hypothetical protein